MQVQGLDVEKKRDSDKGECVMELLSEITFYLKDLSIWQGKYLITKQLLL